MKEHYPGQFAPADFEPLKYTPEEEETMMLVLQTTTVEMLDFKSDFQRECQTSSLLALIDVGDLADGRDCGNY